ncbi:MAG: hypothetical protein DHS20C11_34240 [Lysobacteraceae bacterium]|nr:MAG: hypothetical protein DHS20C11_34240 [Xanthomonadaceae bacterium]
MWKKNDNSSDAAATAPPPPPRGTDGAAVIAEGICIDGDFSGRQDLLIRGEVSGTVNLPQNTVTVGQSGVVKAKVHAATLIIQGRVEGDLRAEDRIQVGANGDVTGNLFTPRLSLEEGARFRGNIDMQENTPAVRTQPKQSEDGHAGKPAIK